MYAHPMTATAEPYVRLAQYIERRISVLALEYAEVCRRAGISDETLGKIRKGMRARTATYLKLERALEWAQGSISAIIAGGEPTSWGGRTDRSEAPSLSQELDLAARLLTATVKEMNLSPEEADEVWAQVRAQILADHESTPVRKDSDTPDHRRTGS